MAVRALRSKKPLAQIFATDLAVRRWCALPEPPTGWWELDAGSGELLLAFCRHRSLAYDWPRGSPDEHRAAARTLVDALAIQRVWSNSSLHEILDADRLQCKEGGCFGRNACMTDATFEQSVVLVGTEFAALVVWTDED